MVQSGMCIWKTAWRFPKQLKIELPCDPATPLPNVENKSTHSKDKCTPISIAALLTVAKIWKQPKCISTDEWIKKMWYLYNRILFRQK